jgi:hypothetical protein
MLGGHGRARCDLRLGFASRDRQGAFVERFRLGGGEDGVPSVVVNRGDTPLSPALIGADHPPQERASSVAGLWVARLGVGVRCLALWRMSEPGLPEVGPGDDAV